MTESEDQAPTEREGDQAILFITLSAAMDAIAKDMERIAEIHGKIAKDLATLAELHEKSRKET